MKNPDLFEQLRLRRKALGLKQQEVADKIGYTRAWVSRFENGRLSTANMVNIELYANAVGVTVQYRLRSLSQEEEQQ